MGSNRLGVWNDAARSIESSLLPPRRRSWWCCSAAVLVLVDILLVGYRVHLAILNAQRRELESVVAKHTTSLDAALASRDAFLRTLAHDLKAPLAGLAWQVEILLNVVHAGRLDPKRLEEGLQAIAAGAAEAVSAIDELHDLMRLEGQGSFPLHLEPVDLCEFVRQLVATCSITARHRVQVESSVASLLVVADRARLSRVLSNLLDNAGKYSPLDSRISVELAERELDGVVQAVVCVTDSGMGIPATDLPHIFDRYHRGGNVAQVPGEGLGLASVKALVALHGGSLVVESREGCGTVVTVRLPRMATPGYDVLVPD